MPPRDMLKEILFSSPVKLEDSVSLSVFPIKLEDNMPHMLIFFKI